MTDDALLCDDDRDGTFARGEAGEPGLAGRGACAPDGDTAEIDALCEAALARFAEALRRAVQD